MRTGNGSESSVPTAYIPLNQKQPPYYSSYAKEGRAGCGTLVVRPVQIGGEWDYGPAAWAHKMGEEGE